MLNYSKTAVFLLILLAISCTPKKKEAKIEKDSKIEIDQLKKKESSETKTLSE